MMDTEEEENEGEGIGNDSRKQKEFEIILTFSQDENSGRNYCVCTVESGCEEFQDLSYTKACFGGFIKEIENNEDDGEFFILKCVKFFIGTKYDSTIGKIKTAINQERQEDRVNIATKVSMKGKLRVTIYDNFEDLVCYLREYCKNLVLLRDSKIKIGVKNQTNYFQMKLDITNQFNVSHQNKVICLCQEKRDPEDEEIKCTKCLNHFHVDCLNISCDDDEEDFEETFVCPICRNRSSGRKRKRGKEFSIDVLEIPTEKLQPIKELSIKIEKPKYSIQVLCGIDILNELNVNEKYESDFSNTKCCVRFITPKDGFVKDEEELLEFVGEYKVRNFQFSLDSTRKWRKLIGLTVRPEMKKTAITGVFTYQFVSQEEFPNNFLVFIKFEDVGINFKKVHKKITKSFKEFIEKKRNLEIEKERINREAEVKKKKELYTNSIGKSVCSIISCSDNEDFKKKCMDIMEVNDFENLDEKISSIIKKII